MEVFDSNILERIISELDSEDLLSLIQTCSHISNTIDIQRLKSMYLKHVIKLDVRQLYLGEHYELPNGTLHGPWSKYKSIPVLFGIKLKLIQRTYRDGECIEEKKWLYCGSPREESVIINNNNYIPI